MNFAFARPIAFIFAAALVSLGAGSGCSSNGSSAFGSLGDAGGSSGGGRADAAPEKDGPPGVDASSCVPGDVSTLKPVWKRPTKFHQGACGTMKGPEGGTIPMWEAYRLNCLGGGDHSGCALIDAACVKCIATADTSDAYGPLIVHHGWVELNVAGCLADAMDDPTGVKCAAAVQAEGTCKFEACNANCPVTDNASFSLLKSCEKAAGEGQCKNYVADATCVASVDTAQPDIATCLGTNLPANATFAENFDAIAKLFCGPPEPPVDAGGGPG